MLITIRVASLILWVGMTRFETTSNVFADLILVNQAEE